MIFKLKEFGTVLESKDLAKRLAEGVLDSLEKNPEEALKLDFSGIRVVSSFFADEFIGVLVVKLGGKDFNSRVSSMGLSAMNHVWIDKAIKKHIKS